MKSNLLIAEFMGLETPDGVYFEYLTKDGERSKPTHFILLEYHTSLDWLTPVVEKIFSLGYDYTIKPRHMIIKERMGEIVSECIGHNQSQEEVIYQAVVEFIKNQNN